MFEESVIGRERLFAVGACTLNLPCLDFIECFLADGVGWFPVAVLPSLFLPSFLLHFLCCMLADFVGLELS